LPGEWAWGVSLSATKLHIEHVETETTPTYSHVQDLWVSELDGTLVRGLTHSLAAQLTLPARSVRDRIRFEDLARQPYVPPDPDTHHRNETLTRVADVRLGLQWARIAPPGRSPRPGGLLAHRPNREQSVRAGPARAPAPAHPVRHGNRGPLCRGDCIPTRWGVVGDGLGERARDAGRERARVPCREPLRRCARGGATPRSRLECPRWLRARPRGGRDWDGRVEEEGNLGRIDLFASLGGSRTFAFATLGATVRVPVYSHVTGAQVDLPIVLQLTLSR